MFGLFANLIPTITFQGQPCKVESIDFNMGFADITIRFPNEQRFVMRVVTGEIKPRED